MAGEISFGDPAVQRCPFAAYDQLRKSDPIYFDPGTGNYVLTRYADVRAVLLDHRRFSNAVGLVGNRESGIREQVESIFRAKAPVPGENIQALDPPVHRGRRILVDRAFAGWNVDALRPHIAEIVHGLIDGFVDQGGCEFVEDFANALPMRIIAEQLGFTLEDLDNLKFWSDCAVEAINPVLTDEREIEISYALADMYAFFIRTIERVRATPDGTLVSQLAHVMVDDEGQPDIPELLALLQALLVGGNETTAYSLSAGMKLLIDNPDKAWEIASDPVKIDAFVEEVLRLMTPTQTLFRRAKEDLEIDGVAIPKGARIEVRYGAANRDPATFEHPEVLDLTRANGRAHLAFGAGIHICIGMQLARVELHTAFAALLERLDNFRAAKGSDSYVWTPMYISYGLLRLDMTFDKRSKERA